MGFLLLVFQNVHTITIFLTPTELNDKAFTFWWKNQSNEFTLFTSHAFEI
jgi:hypothetical protein